MKASFLTMMEEEKTLQLSRRQVRQHVFSLIYNLGFYEDKDFEKMADQYLSSQDLTACEQSSTVRDKAITVMRMRDELDAMIDSKSDHWKTKRIAKVDLAIIRLALYEMLEDEDVPVGVAINEAVRLAKKYSSDQAPGFVNGVLAAFVPDKTEE